MNHAPTPRRTTRLITRVQYIKRMQKNLARLFANDALTGYDDSDSWHDLAREMGIPYLTVVLSLGIVTEADVAEWVELNAATSAADPTPDRRDRKRIAAVA